MINDFWRIYKVVMIRKFAISADKVECYQDDPFLYFEPEGISSLLCVYSATESFPVN